MNLWSRVIKLEKKLIKPNQRVRLVFLTPGKSLESSTYLDNSSLSSPEEKIIVVRFIEPNTTSL